VVTVDVSEEAASVRVEVALVILGVASVNEEAESVSVDVAAVKEDA
jgi:hypothetical protein